MTGSLLIIKTGTTFTDLATRRGDFEDWFVKGLDIRRSGAQVVDVARGDPLPDPVSVAGVVITGSHAMVTDLEEWSEATARWLVRAVSTSLPILGVCYGHQLLAHALGGRVDYNRLGREVGTRDITLHDSACDDPLLGGLPNPLRAQVSHAQAVVELPLGATLLASSDMDPHQAFVVEGCAWGVQFHPEFDVEVMRTYIGRRREQLREQGLDPDKLIDECSETPEAMRVLERFRDYALRG